MIFLTVEQNIWSLNKYSKFITTLVHISSPFDGNIKSNLKNIHLQQLQDERDYIYSIYLLLFVIIFLCQIFRYKINHSIRDKKGKREISFRYLYKAIQDSNILPISCTQYYIARNNIAIFDLFSPHFSFLAPFSTKERGLCDLKPRHER